MYGLNRKPWFDNPASFGKQFQEQKRVFTAGKTYKYMVAIVDDAKSAHSLLKSLLQSIFNGSTHFINTRYTAQMMRKKASIWFQWRFCP